jgi:hypothetical protein
MDPPSTRRIGSCPVEANQKEGCGRERGPENDMGHDEGGASDQILMSGRFIEAVKPSVVFRQDRVGQNNRWCE